MVGRFAKRFVELELVNGPGVIPTGRAGRRKAHFLLVVSQENPKSLDSVRLCSISSLSCLGRSTAAMGGQPVFIGCANSDLTKCQDQR